MGTITYCQDPLDIVIPRESLAQYPQALQDSIHKYAFEPPSGELVLCWDNAKYINHCCSPNSLSTGYEFEIAVRNVEPGEELTTDYRLFSKNNRFGTICEQPDCPRSAMNELPLAKIDQQIQSALAHYHAVNQPLSFLVPDRTTQELQRYFESPKAYISIAQELPA